MGMRQRYALLGCAALLIIIAVYCFSQLLTCCPPLPSALPSEDVPVDLSGRKVAWVNSYHKGYEWSDDEFSAGEEKLKERGILVHQIYMDTKLNDGEEFGIVSGRKAKTEIDALAPDLIIAADDAAQKYLVVPHYKNRDIPVVFCGVNWSAAEYGYPAKNVTGIIEIELIENLLGYLRQHSKGSRIAYVAGNDLSERKIAASYNEMFLGGEMSVLLPEKNTFEEFCAAFRKAQSEVDIVILGGNGSIVDWEEESAIQFFLKNTRKPTGTPNPWMIKYVLVAYCRTAEEQGEWAADAAIRILSGEPPANIPITRNKIGQLYINLDIAERMNVVFSPALLKNARLYPEKK